MTSGTRTTIGVIVLAVAVLTLFAVVRSLRPPGKPAAVVRNSQSADAMVERAERAVQEGNGRLARRLTAEALEADPRHGRARLYHAMFLDEDGRSQDALQALNDIPDSEGLISATARYLEGRILLDLKRGRQAELAFRQALRLNPRYGSPLRELARLYALQLRGPETLQLLSQLHRIRPLAVDEEVIRLLAGRPIVDERQAISELQQFVQQDSEDGASRAALVRYSLLADDRQTAARQIDDAAAALSSEMMGELTGLQGLLYLAEGNTDAAVQLLPKTPPDETAAMSLWELRGQLEMAVEDWKNAIQVYTYLASLNPFDISYHHALAAAYERDSQSESALRIHQETELLDRLERLAYSMQRPQANLPDLATPVISEIAFILEQLGQTAAAADWLQIGLRQNPSATEFASRRETLLKSIPANAEPMVAKPPQLAEFRWSSDAVKSGDNIVNSTVPDAAAFAFEEVAAELGVEFSYFNGQSGRKLIVETIGGGVAVLDYDGDGWPDLYFPQGAHDSPESSSGRPVLNDRLFRNLRGKSFSDRSDAAGVAEYSHSLGGAVSDYDNDGFPDVLVTNLGTNTLYRNQGDGTFLQVEDPALSAHADCSAAAAFADLNRDGLPDLYAVNYVEDWTRICRNSVGQVATCDPREFRGGQDRLFLNDGQGGFADVTESCGIQRTTGDGKGLGIVVLDLDGDHLPDIYVANDGTPNFLFVSHLNQGQFSVDEKGMQAGVGVDRQGRSQAGMGIAASDFDGNGWPDLFVTNFYRETNTLYLNLGHALFDDQTRQSGLDLPSRETLGFGAQALDIDLNGTQDLIVLNGDIDDYSAFGRPWKMKAQVFRNEGAARFVDASDASGPFFQTTAIGRGLGIVDFDRDGRTDSVAVFHDRPAAVLQNQTNSGHGFVSLKLIDTMGAREAVGAVVMAESDGRRQTISLVSGNGFACSNEQRLTIGLGNAARIDQLTIRWADGAATLLEAVEAGRNLILLRRLENKVSAWDVVD